MFTVVMIIPNPFHEDEQIIVSEDVASHNFTLGMELEYDGYRYDIVRLMWGYIGETEVLYVGLKMSEQEPFVTERIERFVAQHLMDTSGN